MKTVACIVLDKFAPFEFGVACEAFGLDRSEEGIPNFDFRIVTPEPGLVRSSMGFSLQVEHDLAFAWDADLVIVPTMHRSGWAKLDPRVVEVVCHADKRGALLLSLCSGAAVLAEAGVLDGKRAATHWMYVAELAEMYPKVRFDTNVLYVQEGRIITSAGTAAALDACLHLLRQEIGVELTNKIARRMVVPPQRDGDQAQFIDQPLPTVVSDSLAPLADWILDNLNLELTVELLAERAMMSPRNFARRFKADFGMTPAAWIGRKRLLRAQHLLEQTDLALEAIAVDCGFGSAAVLRQNFARTLRTTPSAYRSRFQCAVPA